MKSLNAAKWPHCKYFNCSVAMKLKRYLDWISYQNEEEICRLIVLWSTILSIYWSCTNSRKNISKLLKGDTMGVDEVCSRNKSLYVDEFKNYTEAKLSFAPLAKYEGLWLKSNGKKFLHRWKHYKELWECYNEAKFSKEVLSAELSRQKQADRQYSKLAKIFSLQKKQVSTVIELPGFVVSSMGVTATWNKAEPPSCGNYADKKNRRTVVRKSTKTRVCRKRPGLIWTASLCCLKQ